MAALAQEIYQHQIAVSEQALARFGQKGFFAHRHIRLERFRLVDIGARRRSAPGAQIARLRLEQGPHPRMPHQPEATLPVLTTG